MFVYCGNNPVNRVDPTGCFWQEICDFFEPGWNNFKAWVNDTFGCGKTNTLTIDKEEIPALPSFLPVSITDGNELSKIVDSSGNSSKPISVFLDKDMIHPLLSSTVGLKINVSNSTVTMCIGLDNTGIYYSSICGNTTTGGGLKLNISEFKIGFEKYTSIQWDNNIDTIYSNCSLNGWILAYAYCYLTTGQQLPTSSYSYVYNY